LDFLYHPFCASKILFYRVIITIQPKKTKDVKRLLSEFFDKDSLNRFARQTGFIRRKTARLLGHHFLNMLVFMQFTDQEQSLLSFAHDANNTFGVKLTKQAIQKRFNRYGVEFMQKCLVYLLGKQIRVSSDTVGLFKAFNRVRIKDSTKYNLPDSYQGHYQGSGGVANPSGAMISIQYEYDLLTGQSLDLRLTQGNENDQGDASHYTHDIQKGDLFIRDLGYSTLKFFQLLIKKGAFFLSRLSPQLKIYHKDQPDREVDLKDCRDKLKRLNLQQLAMDVRLGSKDKVPVRLIVSLVDQETYQKRIRGSRKGGRNNIKEAFKTRCSLNLFVTNTANEILPAQKIQPTYSLRWQIELIFKVWKSQAKINKIKEVNIHRFECQLLGRLIYLTLHWKLFKWLEQRHRSEKNENILSLWKYYKLADQLIAQLRKASITKSKTNSLLSILIETPFKQLKLEPKNKKPNNYKVFMTS